MIAGEHLDIVQLAVIGPVDRVGADHLGLRPVGVEIVLQHRAAMAQRPEGRRGGHAVVRVRGADDQGQAELVELHLVFDRVGELGRDLAAGERPLDLHAAEALDDLLLGVDQLGLFVAEVERILEAEAGDALLAVEGREGDILAEGELRGHHGQVEIIRPVEDAGAVREREVVRRAVGAGADERQLDLQAGLGVAVEEQALLLAVALVEDDKAAAGAHGVGLHVVRHLHGLREAGPLAEVAGGVEVGHARRVRGVGRALTVADVEEAVLLVQVGVEEIVEQAAQDIELLVLLVVGDPAVAEALEDERDAVHLAVGTGGAAVGPALAVRADEVGHHLDVFLGVGAEGGQLALAQGGVGVELQGRAGEDEGHHAVEVEVAADALLDVVEEAGRAGLLDALGEALDEA
eukprot:Opistho-1_new@94331